MTQHARLSPSASKKWMSCPGSLAMEAPFPNVNSDYSARGTAIHDVAARCLQDPNQHATDFIGFLIDVGTPEEPQQITFDEDMAEIAINYYREITTLTVDRGIELHVEQRVEFSEYIDVPDQFGTVDAHWLVEIAPGVYELCICDLKTGFRFVGTDSPQLKCYALGCLSRYELSHDIRTIRLMIYQPEHGGMREEVITIDELMAFAAELKVAAQRVEEATHCYDPLSEAWPRIWLNPKPNDQDCAFCRAMAVCPSYRREVETAMMEGIEEVVESGAAAVPVEIDLLSSAMKAAPMIEEWIKAVRAEVERRLMAGEEVAGFGLELGRAGNRAWSDAEEVTRMLRQQFRLSIDEACDVTVKSPTQIEKLAVPKKPTKKAPNPAASILTERQWKKLQPFINRSDPKPSVKPLDKITEPWSPTAPTADDMPAIDEEDLT